MTPGTITSHGAIVVDERTEIIGGRVMLPLDQAEAAEAHGWEIVSTQGDQAIIAKGDGDAPVVRL